MNDDDISKLVALLAQFEPGFLPYPVFEQIARLVALPIVEFIPVRVVDGDVEVLLLPRGDDDPKWPGQLHTPGTVIRATDLNQTNFPAFTRILHDELLDTEVGQPHYVGSMLHDSKRGAEQAQLYWVEVTGEPKIGTFYPVNDLPDRLMDSQRDFIKLAAENFAKTTQQ